MRIIYNIKPTVLTGIGTTRQAMYKLMNSVMPLLTKVYGSYGNGYEILTGEHDYVYAYNLQVFKRGKHRSNKHFILYRYQFPKAMLKQLGLKIDQYTDHFKLVKVNKK